MSLKPPALVKFLDEAKCCSVCNRVDIDLISTYSPHFCFYTR